MDTEDTLTDVTNEVENHLEKPKRKVSEKQLAALAAAREKRKTKPNALAAVKKEPIGKVVILPEPEPDIILKKPKAKVKPTIIQFDSSSDSSDDGLPPVPTIIIRKSKKKVVSEAKEEPVPPVAPPRQYIRKAY